MTAGGSVRPPSAARSAASDDCKARAQVSRLAGSVQRPSLAASPSTGTAAGTFRRLPGLRAARALRPGLERGEGLTGCGGLAGPALGCFGLGEGTGVGGRPGLPRPLSPSKAEGPAGAAALGRSRGEVARLPPLSRTMKQAPVLAVGPCHGWR